MRMCLSVTRSLFRRSLPDPVAKRLCHRHRVSCCSDRRWL